MKIYISPPEAFEKRFKIKGISKNWRMPAGISPARVEKLGETNEKILIKYFSKLYNLNKNDMNKINVSYDTISSVFYGMTSKMNIDDINSFISGNFGYVVDKDKKYSDLKFKILSKLGEGSYFGWVPSIKTLEFVWKEIKDR
jgi:hypothetical protein